MRSCTRFEEDGSEDGFYFVDVLTDFSIDVHEILDLANRVHDGSVITSAHIAANLHGREICVLIGKVDGDLTDVRDALGAAAGVNDIDTNVEVLADLRLDAIDGLGSIFLHLGHKAWHHLVYQLHGDFAIVINRMSHQ